MRKKYLIWPVLFLTLFVYKIAFAGIYVAEGAAGPGGAKFPAVITQTKKPPSMKSSVHSVPKREHAKTEISLNKMATSSSKPQKAMATEMMAKPSPAKAAKRKSEFVVSVENGSLKANVVRIVKKAGWDHVIWRIPNDYNWFGSATIRGNSLNDVLTKLLKDYPVQAVFYQANRVVVIVPRNPV